MKVHVVCMANENVVEIQRIYTKESMAQAAIARNPSSDTLKWGYVTLELVTAEELEDMKRLVEMTDAHVEDDGKLGEEAVAEGGAA